VCWGFGQVDVFGCVQRIIQVHLDNQRIQPNGVVSKALLVREFLNNPCTYCGKMSLHFVGCSALHARIQMDITLGGKMGDISSGNQCIQD